VSRWLQVPSVLSASSVVENRREKDVQKTNETLGVQKDMVLTEVLLLNSYSLGLLEEKPLEDHEAGSLHDDTLPHGQEVLRRAPWIEGKSVEIANAGDSSSHWLLDVSAVKEIAGASWYHLFWGVSAVKKTAGAF